MPPFEFSTTTGPSRIIIVRHGDRLDHDNPLWGKCTDRPHDSPLSDRGHLRAHLLGRYLARRGGLMITEENNKKGLLNPADIVFLASPLQRTVETAHGIISGLYAESSLVLPPSQTETTTDASVICPTPTTPSQQQGQGQQNVLNSSYGPRGNSCTSVNIGARYEHAAHIASVFFPPSAVVVSSASSSSASSLSLDTYPLIYLEPGAIEGPYFQNDDIRSAARRGNKRAEEGLLPIEPSSSSTLYKEKDSTLCTSSNNTNGGITGGIIADPGNAGNTCCACNGGASAASICSASSNTPTPTSPIPTTTANGATLDKGVFRGAAFHRRFVSPLVSPLPLSVCPRLGGREGGQAGAKCIDGGNSIATINTGAASGQGGTAMMQTPESYYHIEMSYGTNKKGAIFDHNPTIVEGVNEVPERCREVIHRIANCPLLQGKVVVIVGHAATTRRMVEWLAYTPDGARYPTYTAFSDCVRMSEDEVRQAQETGAESPQPWHRWKVNGVAFETPHFNLM